MRLAMRETTPVIYNSAAVKLLHFVQDVPGRDCFRIHWHERMELLRIRRGTIKVDLGSVRGEIGPDSLVIIHPGQPHSAVCVQAPLEYDVIMFDIRSFFNDTDISRQCLVPVFEGTTRFEMFTSCPEILACADKIIGSQSGSYHAMSLMSEVYRLIFLFYNHCLCDISAADASDEVTKNIISYIETNFAENITIDSLCSRFGYSKPYFCRKFKKHTGLSPMNYLNIFRMETAYRMLKLDEQDIGEIASACGFSDANYFTRCFKNHFGHPPSYFRSVHSR